MNRRGFISSFKSMFNSRREGDPFFFGVQMVINVFGEDDLRRRLHAVIASGGESESPAQKKIFYKRISALLRESVPFFEYGYWDYLTDPDEATDEFNDWVTEVEASMATVDEELGEEIDEAQRLSNEKNYVVVTLAFLLEYGESQGELIEIVESIGEDDYFTPAGFQKLVDAVNYIDFEYSDGDAVFIMPGNEDDGFSWTDMRGEGWEYLKPIMGTIN
jgi:hypothetical protein